MSPPAVIVIILTVVLFACAGVRDIATRRIPNVLCLCVLTLGISAHVLDHTIGPALLGGAAVFCVCVLAWVLGLFGGGDAKLLSAAALLVPAGRVQELVLLTALSGGVLSVLYLIGSRYLPPLRSRVPVGQIARVIRAEHRRILRKASLPYGVAIAFGCITVMMTH